ncbi:dienelactone hydrolase family protein [Cryptosporangium minutisporangium]|uniref:dienelactone hydrolase family protein n=1 Tax=Cryptosporangium minutisporangium TaxID=113569 RepID=UPI0031F00BAE
MGFSSVQVPTPDGVADAFVAHPDEDGPFPAVLVYMDAFGPRPVLQDMARTIADDGFFVLLPNVFYRSGPAPLFDTSDLTSEEGRKAVFAQAAPLISALTADLARRDAGAYLDFLAAQPNVSDGPIGITGYCMGGRLAVRTAAAFPNRVAAAAAFHAGRLVTDKPDSPHLLAGAATAEFYFGHAEHDPSMTPADVAALEQAFDSAGAVYRSEVYPGTEHGFTMSDTAVHDPPALERHWRVLLDLFERTLQRA